MKKNKIFTFFIIIGLIWPSTALAYSNWGTGMKIFSFYDVFFDILSVSIAIVTFFYGLQIFNKIKGGLKKAASMFFVTMSFFIILQAMSIISLFSQIDLTGFFSIIKLLWAIFFLATVFSGRNFVKKILRNKSLSKEQQKNK